MGSFDVSCETGLSFVEPCLQKGDMIFITDANWGKSEQIVTQTSAEGKRFFGGTGVGGRVHLRVGVLEPRPLQRRRRALRVLQGLHQRQLRHAVVARGLSSRTKRRG